MSPGGKGDGLRLTGSLLSGPAGGVGVSRESPAPEAVADQWAELLADADRMAERYRAEGWDALVVTTRDVAILDGDPFGLDVLVPDGEYDRLERLVETDAIDRTHAFRTDAEGVRLLVVVAEAPAAEEAVLVPASLSLEDVETLRQRAEEVGSMYTHVRTLAADARVTVQHEDPELFL
jgi:hypothetical protein